MKTLMFTVELNQPDTTSDRYWNFYDDGTFIILDQDNKESLFQTCFKWRRREERIQYKEDGRWVFFESVQFHQCYQQYLAKLVLDETVS